jgi:hypothetical protein
LTQIPSGKSTEKLQRYAHAAAGQRPTQPGKQVTSGCPISGVPTDVTERARIVT